MQSGRSLCFTLALYKGVFGHRQKDSQVTPKASIHKPPREGWSNPPITASEDTSLMTP